MEASEIVPIFIPLTLVGVGTGDGVKLLLLFVYLPGEKSASSLSFPDPLVVKL